MAKRPSKKVIPAVRIAHSRPPERGDAIDSDVPASIARFRVTKACQMPLVAVGQEEDGDRLPWGHVDNDCGTPDPAHAKAHLMLTRRHRDTDVLVLRVHPTLMVDDGPHRSQPPHCPFGSVDQQAASAGCRFT